MKELNSNNLFSEICFLINEARKYVAETANKTITILYWKIGDKINRDILDNQRADYGKQIVSQLAAQLQIAPNKS